MSLEESKEKRGEEMINHEEKSKKKDGRPMQKGVNDEDKENAETLKEKYQRTNGGKRLRKEKNKNDKEPEYISAKHVIRKAKTAIGGWLATISPRWIHLQCSDLKDINEDEIYRCSCTHANFVHNEEKKYL